MSAFSEMEAEIIRERVLSGLSAAKKNGKVLGRPPLTEKRTLALELFNNNKMSPKEISMQIGLGISTVYKYIKEDSVDS